MESYAPTLLDLAPRDMVSRAILTEIRDGRGIRGDRKIDDYVHLDASHLGREVIEAKLPDIADFCRTYIAVDPAENPIPVQPTAHYGMGGIPTDVDGRVCTAEGTYQGLYAAGECACISVHGANRLGTNSLVDLIVFGRRAGVHMRRYVGESDRPSPPSDAADRAREILDGPRGGAKGISTGRLFNDMQTTMMSGIGICRNEDDMSRALSRLRELRESWEDIRVKDVSRTFNTELLEAFELANLLDLAIVTAASALNRRESRGAHSREDYPDRDDANWLKHTLARLEGTSVRIGYEPVDTSRWEPKPRKY